jgi:site-specific recombinase XerD
MLLKDFFIFHLLFFTNERVKNGLNNARAKGKRVGRERTRNSELIQELRSRNMSYREIARLANCSMSTQLREHLLRIRKETEYVFTDCFGEKLNKGKATRHMREFVTEHKLGEFAWHSFRHAYTYHSIRSGKSLAQIQANLGHKRIETTINIYGNIKSIDDPCPSPYEF